MCLFIWAGRYNGDVQVLGESTKGRRVSDIAMRVGLMLEDYESQLVSLTAGEEVSFSLLNHGFAPEEVAERTRKALEDVGLPGRESYSWMSFRAVSVSGCCWRLHWRYTRR